MNGTVDAAAPPRSGLSAPDVAPAATPLPKSPPSTTKPGCALSRRTPPVIQRKLRVGAADDPLEHQADHAAERVMGTTQPQGVRIAAREDGFAESMMQRTVPRKAAPVAASTPAHTCARSARPQRAPEALKLQAEGRGDHVAGFVRIVKRVLPQGGVKAEFELDLNAISGGDLVDALAGDDG